jgi:hypothetical protein
VQASGNDEPIPFNRVGDAGRIAGHGRKSGRPIAAVLGRFSADLGRVVLD